MGINNKIFKYLVYYPIICARREFVPSRLSRFKASQWYDREQLRSLQEGKLEELLSYVRTNVPYYRELFDQAGALSKSSLEFQTLPLLTKEILWSRGHLLKSAEHFHGRVKRSTSGSTGIPVTVWKTHEARAHELAALWRGYSWAGIDIGDRQGRFWTVPYSPKERIRTRLIDFALHQLRCSASAFDEETMTSYTSRLERFHPKYLVGFVSMLVEYAEFLKRRRRKLSFPLHCVVTSAEVLTGYHRGLLEEVFACPVFDLYGCGEVGPIAQECEKGSFHINSENILVEILDRGRSCQAGEFGEVVVTELNNKMMPLIRYQVGDFAALSPSVCACGRALPIISRIAGRAYDMIYNRQGKMFHGDFFASIFKEVKSNNLGVRAFQIVQTDASRLRVKIEPEEGYGEPAESLIRERIRTLFDSHTTVAFETVKEIEREASGKLRLVVGMDRGPRSQDC